MRATFHLVPLEDTFDRHYAADPGAFVALTLDLDALDVPWRHDDPGPPYPHIYGPIARPAMLARRRVERDGKGRFAGACHRLRVPRSPCSPQILTGELDGRQVGLIQQQRTRG